MPQERKKSFVTPVVASLGSTSRPMSLAEPEKRNSDDDDNWENDLSNPRNWSLQRKWIAAAIVSMYAAITPLTNSVIGPGLPEVAKKYNITSSTVLSMTLSISLLPVAFGPLIMAPLTEMYGRTYVFNICSFVSIAFNLGAAYAPTVSSLIILRLLEGISGSASVTCGYGSIHDLFVEHERAFPMALFALGPLVIGPVIGPIAGGFIIQTVGIKWVFIVAAAVCGVASLLGILLLRETYAPVLRYHKALASSDPDKIAKMHATLVGGTSGRLAFMCMNFKRPIVIFFTNLTCIVLSLYLAMMNGIFFMMLVTFPSFFSRTYGFGPGIDGITYIGLGLGSFSASLVGGKFSDKIYKYLAEKQGGKGTPEMRMPPLFFGSFFVPIGLFWFGWSAQAKLHWIMPILGSYIVGFGIMATMVPILLYIVDTFEFAASATAAVFVVRSIFSFAFPLFAQQMFDRLGLGGGSSLLAGVVMLLGIPFPIWIYYKGESIRKRGDRKL